MQKSVRACETARWSMLSWPAEGGAESHELLARRFLCRSWRCRRCGPYVSRLDLARVQHAALSRRWWLYAVLTFDPREWANPWEAYKHAGRLWNNRLHKRLQNAFGHVEYLQTWERHVGNNYWPHLNLILTGDGLREAVERAGVEWRHDARAGHGKGRACRFTYWRRWLAEAAPACGFGLRVWCEVVDHAEGMAHYIMKAAHDLGAARWKVGDQTPIGAPPHFRRFRASKDLLPKRPPPSGQWTGAISREPLESFVDHETGEIRVSAAAIDAALAGRDAALAWRLEHEPPPPRYEHASLAFAPVEV